MKIECTKEEFQKLFDLVYAGNILINGLRSQEEKIKDYAEMEQTIFAMAKEFGLEEVVEYDEEFKEWMPTHDYEESGINDYLDAYDTQVFWEELVMRLARRDALNYLGDIEPDMTKEQLRNMQDRLEEEYEEEFEYHGLDHLKLVEPPIEKR
ncbi:hypothetical protein CS063_12855 [Sporanaerobium hydrogeniformans]|uniref:Uncharacterized protein n=1 Tax=Sporanaerobium hydrogeniformans TaxID=3072179 RepID=A0AC61DBB3_9FIRM|nr:hypothetical protein [Sporanaerobium hydrogeniformans]PHV70028.1 hypothetical protein CS063_12855 [Sporanaerobium hydrogeniformans]